MIANISPTISCCEQTLNTLRYSSRVKNFKNKSTCINEEDDTNTERISILDSKGSEMNASSIENVVIKSNHLLSNNNNNKINRGKINDKIERNNILKNKSFDKPREGFTSTFGKYSSLNDIDKIKKNKKKGFN